MEGWVSSANISSSQSQHPGCVSRGSKVPAQTQFLVRNQSSHWESADRDKAFMRCRKKVGFSFAVRSHVDCESTGRAVCSHRAPSHRAPRQTYFPDHRTTSALLPAQSTGDVSRDQSKLLNQCKAGFCLNLFYSPLTRDRQTKPPLAPGQRALTCRPGQYASRDWNTGMDTVPLYI